ncbi:MAG: hypothetical protein CMD92_06825 [Gammaproteobacteria bacterium]|nr:hypothetical protein [Gammaproteobacteria bacterium]|tara:strand:+ start:1955 stop:2677 length:723 start_codon:yes stop_codon:yes gene_type:complete
MSSAALAKTIAKLPAKMGKPKPVSSLANLCTETLWKQSIAAGKAEELVATLRATPEGRRALEADAKAHSTRVFVLSIASRSEEGMCGYVSLTEETAWFFELLDALRPTVFNSAPGVYHPLGGYDLRWDGMEECVAWAEEILKNDMTAETARALVQDAVDIEVPMNLESGAPVTDVVEWLDENHEGWHLRLERKFLDLFDVTGDRNPHVLSADNVHTLRKSGWNPVSEAVVTIDFDINDGN